MKPQLTLCIAGWTACFLSVALPGQGQHARPLPANKLISTGDTSICAGRQVSLHTTAGSMQSFSWQPVIYLNDPNSANPVASPQVTTKYILTAMPSPENLVYNGDFSDGNKGFSSGYRYTLHDDGEGQYYVGPSAYAWSKWIFPPCTANADTNDYMMMVNGSVTPHTSVWSQRVSVLPHTSYTFSYRMQSITWNYPAALQLYINGIPQEAPFQSDTNYCIWRRFHTAWDAGNDTSVLISLVDTNTVAPSNDFALDDISFVRTGPYTDSVTISVYPAPNVQAEKLHDIDCATPVTELHATGAVYYSWEPVTGLSSPASDHTLVSIDTSTTYTVKGEDSNGCYAYSSTTVDVHTSARMAFVLPNAFTPNGDGHNDCFSLRNLGDIEVEEFSVYSRRGQCVFTTRNSTGSWDGTYGGHPQPADTYIYLLKAKTFCGPVIRRGTIILVR